jgi:hypothetical protein
MKRIIRATVAPENLIVNMNGTAVYHLTEPQDRLHNRFITMTHNPQII